MDVVHDWAQYLFHVAATNRSPAYLRPLLSIASTARAHLLPMLSEKPDLATIALLLIILFISLKILNMLYQAVMFWVRLAQRIIFWGSIIAIGVWLYNRGPDGAMEDMGYLASTFWQEYQFWKERSDAARMTQQRAGHGGRQARY